MMLGYRKGTRMQGGLVMAKSRRLDRETIFTNNIGLYSTTVTKSFPSV